MRTDNGGEYIGSKFKNILISNRIKHEVSSHVSSQDDMAERSWCTCFDMARYMLLDSKLPKFIWTYALATSNYTKKCCYQQHTGLTPNDMFKGRRPNLKSMVSFGTKCYVYDDAHKRKLDQRPYEGVFVPSYLIYDKSTGAIKE